MKKALRGVRRNGQAQPRWPGGHRRGTSFPCAPLIWPAIFDLCRCAVVPFAFGRHRPSLALFARRAVNKLHFTSLTHAVTPVAVPGCRP